MALQNSQIQTNDVVNGVVRNQQHQDNTPESLKTKPDNHLLPILTKAGHNYAVQVSEGWLFVIFFDTLDTLRPFFWGESGLKKAMVNIIFRICFLLFFVLILS